MLAPDKALETLPISIFVVGMAACILPAGAIARRYGRRMAFLAGAGCGVLVGLLAALAVVIGSFWLFCLADRTRVVSGKSVSVRVDLGGRLIIKKKNQQRDKSKLYIQLVKLLQ